MLTIVKKISFQVQVCSEGPPVQANRDKIIRAITEPNMYEHLTIYNSKPISETSKWLDREVFTLFIRNKEINKRN